MGNIYKGKVVKVLPGMQAAFVDIGLEKAASSMLRMSTEELKIMRRWVFKGRDARLFEQPFFTD